MSDLKLTDREWGVFKIGDIFKVLKVLGKPLEKYDNGCIPYVSTSNKNNAVIDFVNASIEDISPCNVLSVDPIKGKVLYHPYKFVGRGFSGASINILENKNINERSALFLCKCIEKSSMSKASYGYLFNSNRLINGMFKLPTDCFGNPDWQFMEDYIKQIETKQRKQILIYYKSLINKDILQMGGNIAVNNNYPIQKIKLIDREWRVFKIGDIFKVSGTKTTHPSMLLSNGKTPRITCASTNNALDGFYKNAPTEKGEVITVDSATDAYLSYQKNDFIATDHVEKISMKGNLYMSKEIGLFLKKAIDNSKLNKFGYGYKFSQTRIKKQLITLPVDKNNNPDWQFMEIYIKYKQLKIVKKIIEYYVD